MNFFRHAISITLLIGVLVYPSSYSAENANQPRITSRCFNLLKKTSTVASGVGLALIAHVMTELPIVTAHEYGHYLGNSLSGGSGGSGGTVEVECKLHKHPLAILRPFLRVSLAKIHE